MTRRRPAGATPAPARPATVVVDGLDEDPQPGPLLELLARLRALGFRLLLVFRHEGGTGWNAARDDLLRPALLRHADALLGRLELAEFGNAIRRDVVDSASLDSVTETADLRRAELRRTSALPDPQRQLPALRALLRTLRADLDRQGGR